MNPGTGKILTYSIISMFLLLFNTGANAQTISSVTTKTILADSSRSDSLKIAPEPKKSEFDTTLYYDAKIIDSDVRNRITYLIGDAVVKYKNMMGPKKTISAI